MLPVPLIYFYNQPSNNQKLNAIMPMPILTSIISSNSIRDKSRTGEFYQTFLHCRNQSNFYTEKINPLPLIAKPFSKAQIKYGLSFIQAHFMEVIGRIGSNKLYFSKIPLKDLPLKRTFLKSETCFFVGNLLILNLL